MNRRDFLATIGAGISVLAFPGLDAPREFSNRVRAACGFHVDARNVTERGTLVHARDDADWSGTTFLVDEQGVRHEFYPGEPVYLRGDCPGYSFCQMA
jgi:hypothetical protein